MGTKREQKAQAPTIRYKHAMQGEPCECGWKIGQEACRARFDELLARDFSDPIFFRTHRLFVDIYALQHPAQFCVSAKSLAAHLGDLCAILEHGAGTAIGLEALNRWLDGCPMLEKPPLPKNRGAITLGDVADADTPQWSAELHRWGASVWKAYGELHPWAQKILAALTP
jgi:hypothetical protein